MTPTFQIKSYKDLICDMCGSPCVEKNGELVCTLQSKHVVLDSNNLHRIKDILDD